MYEIKLFDIKQKKYKSNKIQQKILTTVSYNVILVS